MAECGLPLGPLPSSIVDDHTTFFKLTEIWKAKSLLVLSSTCWTALSKPPKYYSTGFIMTAETAKASFVVKIPEGENISGSRCP